MKRIIYLLVLFFTLLIRSPHVLAQPGPFENEEHIKKFQDDIIVNTDGSILVKEHIVYNFGPQARHGIFRNIPVITTNKEGKKYRMTINVESVQDEYGNSFQYDTSGTDTISIKIGDPDKTITGEQIYIITYTVKGALTYFSDHDELYWNATGNEWHIPIAASSAIIHLPENIPSEKIKASCYSGYTGSTEQNCTVAVKGTTVTINSTKSLQSSQGLTIVVGFPKGIVSIVEPTEVKAFFSTLLGKITIVSLIIGSIVWYLLLPLWLPIRWWMKGRDPKDSTGPVQAWFDLPKTVAGRPLTPAETGTVIDENAGIEEISALIVNLAQRGYLKIVEKEKNDYEFVKTEDFNDEQLMGFEKAFLNSIFAGKEVLRLKEARIADDVQKIQNMLYDQLVTEGYFPENPQKVRNRYAILTALAVPTFNFFLLVSAAIFGRIMPRKTLAGVEATHVAKSLRNFLTSQERQLEFQAKNQMMFEKLLPFAIAFGVEKIWADRFQDITLQPPAWFVSSQPGVFNSQSFTRGLGSSMSAFKSAATPVSSSTGHSSGFSGGSSGGGGGGGGGGSW